MFLIVFKMPDCVVCYESKNVRVSCAKCGALACVSCFQTHLLNSTLTPCCLGCRTGLSDEFVIQNTLLGWRIKKYKPYREQLLYESEKARLPDTQVHAEIYQKARTLFKKASEELAKVEAEWGQEKVQDETLLSLDKRLALWTHQSKIHVPKSIINACRPSINSFGLWDFDGRKIVKGERKVAVKACITTGCPGFLNADFSCGLCSTVVCKACHEAKVVGEHVCNEDTVATIKAIKAETRSCPTCATLISKIDGCDQMWCTQCQTTFSWRTGQVEAGHTHNPHYYEWMRKNGGLPRAPGDGGGNCELPHIQEVQGAITNKETLLKIRGGVTDVMSPNDKLVLSLLETHRELIHVEHAVRLSLHTGAPDNYVLRVKFLTKEITEDKFKALIQQRDKAYRKNVAKNQIYQMTYTVASDLYRIMLTNKNTVGTKKELDALFNYSNDCLTKVAEAYSCKVELYKIL
jgi:hypothetical protein